MSFIEFVEGPLYYVAATIFVLGALWRVVGIIRIGRKKDISPPKGSAAIGFVKGNLRHFFPRGPVVFSRRVTPPRSTSARSTSAARPGEWTR